MISPQLERSSDHIDRSRLAIGANDSTLSNTQIEAVEQFLERIEASTTHATHWHPPLSGNPDGRGLLIQLPESGISHDKAFLLSKHRTRHQELLVADNFSQENTGALMLATMAAVIVSDRPEEALLDLAASGIEHWRGGLVHEQAIRASQMPAYVLGYRLEMEAGPAFPIAQCGAIQLDALASVDLGLTAERQVMAELGDDNLGDQRLDRQAARHHMLEGMGLHDPPEQWRQAYFGRRVTSTRNCAGITSSRSLTS